MAKTLEARVKQKKDTLENWNANQLVLLDGEQAFVVDEDGNGINFKIGDGTKTFAQLPWFNIVITGDKMAVVDNMAQMRSLPQSVITRLQSGQLSGVTLNGYHTKGDTPRPIEYFLTTDVLEDNGGDQIIVGGVNFISYNSALDLRYFGWSDNIDSSDIFINAILKSKVFEITVPIGRTVIKSETIIPSSIPNKKIVGISRDKSIISIEHYNFLNISNKTSIENLTIDFNNGLVRNGVWYNPNIGNVKIKGISIQNIKDTDSTRGSNILYVSAQGNVLDISDIKFNNIKKVGNGSITDSGGSVQGVFVYGNTNLLGGTISDISVNDFHNINTSESIIFEDTAGIFIGVEGKRIPLYINNVNGFNFGKRLIKIQGSGINMSNINGYVETNVGDSLSVVGILSEPSLFDSVDNTISNLTASGNITYPIADNSKNTNLSNINIDIIGSSTLTSGVYAGILINGDSSNLRLTNYRIKARRPIAFAPDVSTNNINNTSINNGTLILTSEGVAGNNAFISVTGNTSISLGKITNLSVNNCICVQESTRADVGLFFTNHAIQRNYENFVFSNITMLDYKSNADTINSVLGVINYVKNVTFDNIKYNPLGGVKASNIGDWGTFTSCDIVNIDNIQYFNKSNRSLLFTNCSNVSVGNSVVMLDAGVGNLVFTGSGSGNKIDVENLKVTNALAVPSDLIYHTGITANRPTNAPIGFKYFDTTINRAIFKSSGGWVDNPPSPNASLSTKGLVNQSAKVDDVASPDANDLDTALTLLNELKYKFNEKLVADRSSGQQSTT